MTHEEMVDALVADMENWDNESILDYALSAYRSDLEGHEGVLIQTYYDDVLGEKE